MPTTIKLRKKTKGGIVIKYIAQAAHVVLERRMKTTGRVDTTHVCESNAQARTKYKTLVAKARADGFVDATARPKTKTPKARKAPSARRRTSRA